MMVKSADLFFSEGCGRCSLYATPQCKVQTWRQELKAMRRIVNSCGLKEESKWGMPVYTLNGKNVVMIAAFKDNCLISFFKGSLLADESKLLLAPGENTQTVRVIRFTDVKQVLAVESELRNYIFEAIEVEKAGLKPEVKKITELPIPVEFAAHLKKNKSLKAAFDSLTPGRRKAYILHFSGAKQSATRESRIQKCIPDILAGYGFGERRK